GGAFGHDEAGGLTARRLDRRVHLAGRHTEALGDQLEVVNQRLHAGGQLVAGRQGDLAVVGYVGALGQAVERLLDDPERLAHLLHAHAVAVVVVAHGADRDVELEVVVRRVRRGLAQVPRLAGGP